MKSLPSQLPIWADMKQVSVHCSLKIYITLSSYNIILARTVWKTHLYNSNAIIFIVDSSNRDRLAEAAAELNKLLTDEKIKTVPILILGNKIDVRGALSENELKAALGVTMFLTGKQSTVEKGRRPMELFMCSIIHGRGYKEAIQWLSQYF